MLDAAERLLAASPEHDISTRAVCDAVGVGQPTLYRLFGDKAGLLSALVDYGFDRYIQRKMALTFTENPVDDLRRDWDDHIAFALENSALYRLIFSPMLSNVPAAPRSIFELLVHTLERCAEVGSMLVPPVQAAQAILSANIGVALALLVRPEIYTDPGLSDRVRDAIFASCIAEPAHYAKDSSVPRSAIQLAAQLRSAPASQLGDEEQRLLLKWLDNLHSPVGEIIGPA